MQAGGMYPNDLILVIRASWRHVEGNKFDPKSKLPSDTCLKDLLNTCYQTSHLQEEGRPISFRVVYYPKSSFGKRKKQVHWFDEYRVLAFQQNRPFTPQELRRLAPAIEPSHSLICVELSAKGSLQIWGVIDAGSIWWNFIHDRGDRGPTPPTRLIVSSQMPGELVISSAGMPLCTLKHGEIQKEPQRVLYESIFSNSLEPCIAQLRNDTPKYITSYWEKMGFDYSSILYKQCLEHLVNFVQKKKHGGDLPPANCTG